MNRYSRERRVCVNIYTQSKRVRDVLYSQLWASEKYLEV